MKVLVFGPSGSGKSYIANNLKRLGINAFDEPDIDGLSAWYDKNGYIVPTPKTAAEALNNNYAFLWSKKSLNKFLSAFSTVYIFGGSGNVSSIFELFDKVYFLKIDPKLQKDRLLDPARPTPLMDVNNGDLLIWGEWLEQMAKENNIPFIDATQTPQQIFNIISK